MKSYAIIILLRAVQFIIVAVEMELELQYRLFFFLYIDSL